MILDVEKVGCLVRSPDGPGTIVVVEQDIKSFECCAVVRLEEDNSLQTYTEKELQAMTAEPKQKKEENK